MRAILAKRTNDTLYSLSPLLDTHAFSMNHEDALSSPRARSQKSRDIVCKYTYRTVKMQSEKHPSAASAMSAFLIHPVSLLQRRPVVQSLEYDFPSKHAFVLSWRSSRVHVDLNSGLPLRESLFILPSTELNESKVYVDGESEMCVELPRVLKKREV